MTKAEELVAKYQEEARRIIYTTQEAWDERRIEMNCVGSCINCVNSHSCVGSCVGSCIYATPIAFS
jgi:hypothetical protein